MNSSSGSISSHETVQENLGKDIALVTSQVNATRSRIVQSPDRIRKYISEMSIQAREERATIAAAESKSRELKTKLDALSIFEQVRITQRNMRSRVSI